MSLMQNLYPTQTTQLDQYDYQCRIAWQPFLSTPSKDGPNMIGLSPLQAQDLGLLLCHSFGLKSQWLGLGQFDLGPLPCWLVHSWVFGLLFCNFETQQLHFRRWSQRFQWCRNLERIVGLSGCKECPGKRQCDNGLWQIDLPQRGVPQLGASLAQLCFGTEYLELWIHHQLQLHW